MAMAEPAIAGRRNRVIKPPTPEPEPDLMGSPAVSGALVGLAFKLPLSALPLPSSFHLSVSCLPACLLPASLSAATCCPVRKCRHACELPRLSGV
ncbi:unnamed protein product [Prorocentrum cordatum]|uniref:Uncharacterized protein n=1 Tax=Prorocentrum cordatum TaxID=2364126 RepID=A0ABN9WRK2_9DINO|nr:unnamed protein product [Polarella glacialis]